MCIVHHLIYNAQRGKILAVKNLTNGKCPRCGREATELGAPVIKVGKTRQMRVSFKQCSQCSLVFYEGLEKESTG